MKFGEKKVKIEFFVDQKNPLHVEFLQRPIDEFKVNIKDKHFFRGGNFKRPQKNFCLFLLWKTLNKTKETDRFEKETERKAQNLRTQIER